ncbi:uncharacterized protein V2V93DRAFT_399463, partial [Kockiozyma suomiensis]|uniref:uncharacterized protein n=1 Tax=Kockiozyma suomiensis TaxID=1337062 RepID=UPI0033436DB1
MPSQTPDIELAPLTGSSSAVGSSALPKAPPNLSAPSADHSLVASNAMAKRATTLSTASTGSLRQKRPIVFQVVRVATIVIYFTTAVLTYV